MDVGAQPLDKPGTDLILVASVPYNRPVVTILL